MGGAGYSFEDVGNMTLDQIFFRLCDKEVLVGKIGGRTTSVKSLSPNKDGEILGRTADGKQIRGRIGGKSLARRLMEEQQMTKSDKRKKRAAARELRRQKRNGS